ncbi:solute carrier family 25 (mitochondrial S-adenosylmethionine transporter), member 26 [Strigomonas culicis]|uniref:Solute carrier family 25 (Mitochondrial S-adenosylmethionine transporter), member 26 n=2 Tax=Strigomonas culicis TaxID=28005 RepID=S9U743_9TRYP|nr:solute carrier family 25 (mitochondrial S-adenosylmethionine transporter), member 26 [Strigomonas culicis]|eukprot:EPY24723.1 solute carrier family 25 (mitochondrial S-adenosylmethionine transporter), member 26 [Strigomonas culicis]
MDSFIAGAAAGLLVDLSLYPIDTMKTRVQSSQGFLASGGFKNIYKGLSAVAVGSVPGGAAFFTTYDTVRRQLFSYNNVGINGNVSSQSNLTTFSCQAIAAACGESAACCVRVPVEMVKQQMQAGFHPNLYQAVVNITNNVDPSEAVRPSGLRVRVGGLPHLFSGMPIMLIREIPFSVIQMSLYESLKFFVNKSEKYSEYFYYLLPLLGAISGGCSAFLTTPLDVIKTRIMLQRKRTHRLPNIRSIVREIATEPSRPGDRFGTVQKFFRGGSARVLWISLGGSIFFGSYEFVKSKLALTQ